MIHNLTMVELTDAITNTINRAEVKQELHCSDDQVLNEHLEQLVDHYIRMNGWKTMKEGRVPFVKTLAYKPTHN